MAWQKYLKAYKEAEAPDTWEFLLFICAALDEAKIPLPAEILGKSDKTDEGVT